MAQNCVDMWLLVAKDDHGSRPSNPLVEDEKSDSVMKQSLLICGCFLFSFSATTFADDYPCGPDGMPRFLKRMVPQGAFGADFRPACRQHDRCYSACGADRKQCDRQLKADMHCACQHSKHPVLCRMAANHRYRMTRLFGLSPFRKSQP